MEASGRPVTDAVRVPEEPTSLGPRSPCSDSALTQLENCPRVWGVSGFEPPPYGKQVPHGPIRSQSSPANEPLGRSALDYNLARNSGCDEGSVRTSSPTSGGEGHHLPPPTSYLPHPHQSLLRPLLTETPRGPSPPPQAAPEAHRPPALFPPPRAGEGGGLEAVRCYPEDARMTLEGPLPLVVSRFSPDGESEASRHVVAARFPDSRTVLVPGQPLSMPESVSRSNLSILEESRAALGSLSMSVSHESYTALLSQQREFLSTLSAPSTLLSAASTSASQLVPSTFLYPHLYGPSAAAQRPPLPPAVAIMPSGEGPAMDRPPSARRGPEMGGSPPFTVVPARRSPPALSAAAPPPLPPPPPPPPPLDLTGPTSSPAARVERPIPLAAATPLLFMENVSPRPPFSREHELHGRQPETFRPLGLPDVPRWEQGGVVDRGLTDTRFDRDPRFETVPHFDRPLHLDRGLRLEGEARYEVDSRFERDLHAERDVVFQRGRRYEKGDGYGERGDILMERDARLERDERYEGELRYERSAHPGRYPDYQIEARMERDLPVRRGLILANDTGDERDMHLERDMHRERDMHMERHILRDGDARLDREMSTERNVHARRDMHMERDLLIEKDMRIERDMHIGRDMHMERHVLMDRDAHEDREMTTKRDIDMERAMDTERDPVPHRDKLTERDTRPEESPTPIERRYSPRHFDPPSERHGDSLRPALEEGHWRGRELEKLHAESDHFRNLETYPHYRSVWHWRAPGTDIAEEDGGRAEDGKYASRSERDIPHWRRDREGEGRARTGRRSPGMGSDRDWHGRGGLVEEDRSMSRHTHQPWGSPPPSHQHRSHSYPYPKRPLSSSPPVNLSSTSSSSASSSSASSSSVAAHPEGPSSSSSQVSSSFISSRPQHQSETVTVWRPY